MSFANGARPTGGFASQYNNTSSQASANHQRMYCKPNTASIWAPSFMKGHTVIRPQPVPEVGPNGPQWSPYRMSAAVNDFGGWIRTYIAFRAGGNPQVSFIVANPDSPTECNPDDSPAVILHTAIAAAVRQSRELAPGWAAALDYVNNRVLIPQKKQIFLMQPSIMQAGEQPYPLPKGMGQDDTKPIVFEVTRDGGDKMLSLFNELLPGQSADTTSKDWRTVMKYGDPIAWNQGAFVTFYNLSKGDPRTAVQIQQTGWTPEAIQGQGGGREKKEQGYGVYVEPTFFGKPADFSGLEPMFRSRLKPWEELLWFPSFAEQAAILESRIDPKMLAFAWAEHPHWISETLRRKIVAAQTVTGIPPMPGVVQNGAAWGLPPGAPPMNAATGGWGSPMGASGPVGGPGDPGVPGQVAGWGQAPATHPAAPVANPDAGMPASWPVPQVQAGAAPMAAPQVPATQGAPFDGGYQYQQAAPANPAAAWGQPQAPTPPPADPLIQAQQAHAATAFAPMPPSQPAAQPTQWTPSPQQAAAATAWGQPAQAAPPAPAAHAPVQQPPAGPAISQPPTGFAAPGPMAPVPAADDRMARANAVLANIPAPPPR